MATTITLYVVTEAEINLLKENLVPARTLFAHRQEGYPDSHWHALREFLTRAGVANRLPEADLSEGDLALPHVELGAHVIFAGTNRRLAALLSLVTEAQVAAYVREHEREFAALYPGEGLRSRQENFWRLFYHLWDLSYRAREINCGLLFLRWEA